MQSVTKGDCTTCIPAAAGNEDRGFPARSLAAPRAWSHPTGAQVALGWDGKHPLDMALGRSTCKEVFSCPEECPRGMTVLPSREGGTAPWGAAKENGLVAIRAQSRVMLVDVPELACEATAPGRCPGVGSLPGKAVQSCPSLALPSHH